MTLSLDLRGGWVIGALASNRRTSVCALTVTLTRLSLIAINEQICNPNRRWWCCRRCCLSACLGGCWLRSVNQSGSPKGCPAMPQSQMPQVALGTRRVVADKKTLQALCCDSMSICSPLSATLPLRPHPYIDCRQIWQLNVDARVPAENISVASLYSSFFSLFCRLPGKTHF